MFVICPKCYLIADAQLIQDVANLECPKCGCEFWVNTNGVILLIERKDDHGC